MNRSNAIAGDACYSDSDKLRVNLFKVAFGSQ
jgi:hypothetical protein